MSVPEMTPGGYLLTKDQQAKIAAMMALPDADRETIHGLALQCAVRALIATHPDPKAVQEVFDQIYGPLLASPQFIDKAGWRAAHEVFGKTIFAPHKLP